MQTRSARATYRRCITHNIMRIAIAQKEYAKANMRLPARTTLNSNPFPIAFIRFISQIPKLLNVIPSLKAKAFPHASVAQPGRARDL